MHFEVIDSIIAMHFMWVMQTLIVKEHDNF